MREHTNHPRVVERGAWRDGGRVETGTVREPAITLEGSTIPWRRIDLALDVPTVAGEDTIRMWSNLPATVDMRQIARAYRKRWTVEGMFGRLESVLHSEIATLGQPRAALLGFAVSMLAYNVLALIARCIARAHEPKPEVSFFHLVVQIRSGYDGMMIALPSEHWTASENATFGLADRLLQLARRIRPKSIAVSKRAPKAKKPKGYVEAVTARAHVATTHVMAKAKLARRKGWVLKSIGGNPVRVRFPPSAPGIDRRRPAVLRTPFRSGSRPARRHRSRWSRRGWREAR